MNRRRRCPWCGGRMVREFDDDFDVVIWICNECYHTEVEEIDE